LFVAGRLLVRRAPLEYEGRRQVPWTGADVLMVSALCFLLQCLPLAVLRLQGFEPFQSGKLPAGSEMTFLIAQAVAGAASFAISVLWLAVRAGAGCDALGCSLGNWRRDLSSGLVAATFIIPPVLGVQAVLASRLPSEHPLITSIKANPALLPVAAVLAVLFAPLLEEFLFRVVLQGWLEKAERSLRRRSPKTFSWPRGVLPVLASSLAFAAAHVGHGADPVPLFLLALVLGYLYRQTHRLWPSLVLHMTLNALTTALVWVMVSA
jgi:membrane protease YdiL (CAAX protease family)